MAFLHQKGIRPDTSRRYFVSRSIKKKYGLTLSQVFKKKTTGRKKKNLECDSAEQTQFQLPLLLLLGQ